MFNAVGELVNKISTSLSIVVSLSATMVAGFTINDVAMLVGIGGTIILAVFNYARQKRERAAHQIALEKHESEEEEHVLVVNKLTLEIELLNKKLG